MIEAMAVVGVVVLVAWVAAPLVRRNAHDKLALPEDDRPLAPGPRQARGGRGVWLP